MSVVLRMSVALAWCAWLVPLPAALGQSDAPARSRGRQPGEQAARQPAGETRQESAAPPTLTPEQEAALDAVLLAWEERSAGIKTLSCDISRWTWNEQFGKRDADGKILPVEQQGEINYARPDKGEYRIDGDGGEHWVCDGLAIFEFNGAKEQLIERTLPPEMQGQAINDGPLPFLFNSEARKLKQRYFLQLVTPESVQGQIWLRAYPRYRLDAANFQVATLILNAESFLPHALEIYLPNSRDRTVHEFKQPVVNSRLRIFQRDFSQPRLPRGWTHVVEAPPAAAEQPTQGEQSGARPRRTQRR